MKSNPSTNYSWWDELGLRDKKETQFFRKGGSTSRFFSPISPVSLCIWHYMYFHFFFTFPMQYLLMFLSWATWSSFFSEISWQVWETLHPLFADSFIFTFYLYFLISKLNNFPYLSSAYYYYTENTSVQLCLIKVYQHWSTMNHTWSNGCM